ncbi:MAG: hypothetical protein DMF84_13455 [Acidobacteria bacterium]|nr:MAG: hypothetical protein DMF84_13455 [Acidobacteriota bacterium]
MRERWKTVQPSADLIAHAARRMIQFSEDRWDGAIGFSASAISRSISVRLGTDASHARQLPGSTNPSRMTQNLTIGICVPTVGEQATRNFFDAWRPCWQAQRPGLCIRVFVHEDNQTKTLDSSLWRGLEVTYTAQDDIARQLSGREWIIPKGSGACRCFPMYLAWKAGCDYIVTLDYDCYPEPEHGGRYLSAHLESFTRDRWFRTIDGDEARGIPYERLGKLGVRINHGLWSDVPDLDGPTSLMRMREPRRVSLRSGHEVVPPGMAFPLCAMNVCYHRSVIPAAYNLLMGLDTAGFDRFDDIWSGILLKRILDYKGWYVTTGEPFVRHVKRSNAFTNLRKEALGIQVHEYLWEYILDTPIEPGLSVTGAFTVLARRMREFPERVSAVPCPSGYFPRLADAMIAWTELFESSIPDP